MNRRRDVCQPALRAYMNHILLMMTLLTPSGAIAASAEWPTPLTSERDIAKAPPSTHSITMATLPIELYPKLRKFYALKYIKLFKRGATGATDEKLRVLASLGFTNLQEMTLFGSRLVTDEGIKSLSKVKSLRVLVLEGTAITDEGAKHIASEMALSGVGVRNIKGITSTGLKALISARSLKSLTFSADQASQTDIIELIDVAGPNMKRIEISDPPGKLREDLLRSKGAERNIKVSVLTKDEAASSPELLLKNPKK